MVFYGFYIYIGLFLAYTICIYIYTYIYMERAQGHYTTLLDAVVQFQQQDGGDFFCPS